MFEIFELCGKKYEFMPYGLEIAVGLIGVSIFISAGSYFGKIRYLGIAFFMLFGAGYLIFKDRELKKIMLVDAIQNIRCVDPILENYQIFNNYYEDKAELITKMAASNIIQYDGKNKVVLYDLYRRYSYGVNGLEKDERKAKRIAERLGF